MRALFFGSLISTSCFCVRSTCVGKSEKLRDEDCNAFQALHDSLGGDKWTACNNTRNDPCACDGEQGDVCATGLGKDGMNTGVCCLNNRISRIVLHHNHLVGTLPSNLGSLADLLVLDLDGNYMTGTLPSELAKLTKLKALYLGGQTNKLSGALPIELGALTDLRYFDINGQLHGHSDFSAGTIPLGLASAPLVDLKLPYANISGRLPAFNFDKMTNCGWSSCCDLTGNSFSCPLPSGASEHCNATCVQPPPVIV